MNRSFIGFLTFFLTFGISFSLVGLLVGFQKMRHNHPHHARSQDSATIASVLDRDDQFGIEQNLDMKRLAQELTPVERSSISNSDPRVVKLTYRYVSRASSIDAGNTPEDFQYAWNVHIQAWKAHSEALKKADEVEMKRTDAAISETWQQVLRIAERYGVWTAKYPR